MAKLEALGFVWDRHEAEREAQLARLTVVKPAWEDKNSVTQVLAPL